ncbi:MAG: hypothetical protein QNI84_05630 [Henriciella sp.]|nr:hypothetical protein [Henriciella sp.]
MRNVLPNRVSIALASLAISTSALLTAGSAQAQVGERVDNRVERRGAAVDRAVDRGPLDRAEDRIDRRHRVGPPPVTWKAPRVRRAVAPPPVRPVRRPVVVAPRARVVRGVSVYRYYGPTIYGYGYHYVDDDAFPWLAFTAITLKVLDLMNEEQVRAHEQAQIEATASSVGEEIYWEQGDATGSVTALRQGTNTSGEQCREFYHNVKIGDQVEEAYGIACLQPDGAWRVLD